MRFAPPAAALALILFVTASMGQAQQREPNQRAMAFVAEGRNLLDNGNTQGAVDAFEAALAIDPSINAVFLDLAAAALAEGLPGKAIHFYREAQRREPDNFAAISGEGQALVGKGALSAARENLATLENRCGIACVETQLLAAAIAGGGPVMTAEAISPDSQVTQN